MYNDQTRHNKMGSSIFFFLLAILVIKVEESLQNEFLHRTSLNRWLWELSAHYRQEFKQIARSLKKPEDFYINRRLELIMLIEAKEFPEACEQNHIDNVKRFFNDPSGTTLGCEKGATEYLNKNYIEYKNKLTRTFERCMSCFSKDPSGLEKEKEHLDRGYIEYRNTLLEACKKKAKLTYRHDFKRIANSLKQPGDFYSTKKFELIELIEGKEFPEVCEQSHLGRVGRLLDHLSGSTSGLEKEAIEGYIEYKDRIHQACEKIRQLSERILAFDESMVRPLIVSAPTEVVVSKGDLTTIVVAVVGIPQPDLIWYKDMSEVFAQHDDRIAVSVEILLPDKLSITKLTISNARITDAGDYLVRAKNNLGEAETAPIKLKFNESILIDANRFKSLFECTLCLEYSRPPILQCPEGHLICSECRPYCSICSMWIGTGNLARNILLERVGSLTSFNCEASETDCINSTSAVKDLVAEDLIEY